MLNPDNFYAMLKKLGHAYDREVKTERSQIYFEALRLESDSDLSAVYDSLLATCKRFPTIVDIRDSFRQVRTLRGGAVTRSEERKESCPMCHSEKVNFVGRYPMGPNGQPLGSDVIFAKCMVCNHEEPYVSYRAKLYGRS